MAVPLKTFWVVLAMTFFTVNLRAAETGRRGLHGHVPAVVHGLVARGVLPDTNELTLAIGLPLRNQAELSELIRQLYDPASINFHRFIQPPEFTARFGPTEEQYQAVQDFVRSNGFIIMGRHGNRLVLDVQARAAAVERAFRITLRTYRHPTENRDFFAPDTEPSVPTNLPVSDMWGLSDYGRPKPLSHLIDPRKMAALRTTPLGGSGFEGFYAGNDFRNAYVPGTPLTGAGQSVALLQFSSYFKSDITNYENFIGRTNFIDVTNVVLSGGTPNSSQNNETALDIEMAIAMAPQLSRIIVYEEKMVLPNSILSRMANDNLARQLSSSWSWTGGPSVSVDAALQQMIAQGQSYFQASGDSDAYTGNETLDNAGQTTAPMDTTNVTCVGGTTLTMTGTGASWAAEKAWNYTPFGAPFLNEGSGGGVSVYYTIPAWQLNVDTNVSQGSGTFRNIPDVALTGDGVTVIYTSGTSTTNGAAGTSCAAPLWAGFCALLNQQSVASSGSPVGFLNPALYSVAAGTNYANCFHDIVTGNNIGTNTANQFYATNGYDLCTGLGTPNGVNLINVLAPRPAFLTQPNSLNVTNGTNVTITAIPLGAPQWSFQWVLNGTNLPAGGNVSGVNTNTLTITAVTPANAGNYSLVFTNPYGAITSSVAVLMVGFGPALSAQPTNLTLLTGSTAVFNSVASGSAPLSFQWQKNGGNLVNGPGIAGATTNILTLTGITTNNTGVYAVVITNLFGTASSTGATLTVVVPPTISASSVTNRTVECGANVTNSVAVAGTLPLAIQWSVDAVPVSGATGSSFTVVNIHPSSHTISVVVTNLYGTITSNAMVTVQDTQAPVIILNGAAVLTNELGHAFVDPGATANDVCAGVVAVTTNGTVNVSVAGTNVLVYTASDGNGNTGTNTRIVLVRDTTPPAITWSFTNLVLVADASCQAAMTNVTGTNFILASDASGTVIITQSPTNNAPLAIGTNLVVITVMDLSSNAAFSTNTVVVLDQTPPTITLLGAAQMTNELGQAFADPGAVAADTCAGPVLSLATNGAVNINATGTNTLTYIATDHSGNTNGVGRTVIVLDTTPPSITWSFTNLFLPLDTNCAAVMPDVTGTNFIVATDLSNPLTYAQSIPTNTGLPLGTNVVVITVTDAEGNAAGSTNLIVVTDTNLPVLAGQPQSLTNDAGSAASFMVTATACTAITYQWLFNNVSLTNENQDSLTVSNVTAIQAGNYSVVVTSAGGTISSAEAVLTVNRLVPGLTLDSSENPAGYRDRLNFIAGVTPTNATGAIQFLTNGAAFDLEPLILGAAASTNLAALPRGTNLIAAVYSGDATYLSLTNVLCQIVTNHPPQVAPAFYTLTAGLNLEIPVASLATNWSDADGDPLSLAAISVSTNGVTITNTTPDLFYADSNDVNDQFTCFVTDGFGGTNSEVVTILVTPQTNSTPGIAGVSIQPGGVTLQLTGGYGSTYILLATTNLLSGGWQSLTTNQPGVTGVWIYTDTQFTNYPQQFYRLELAP